jgi:sRNA-binding carbon storage regulator CsrA
MLDQAIKIGANACREVDVLKKELDRLKKKMKEEEKAKAKAEAQTQQKE